MNFIKGLESLLEQVDQTAQKLAHKEGDDATDVDGAPSNGSALKSSADSGAGRTSGTSASGRIQAHSRPATKPRSDDEIFAFLNTPVTGGSTSTPSSPARPATAPSAAGRAKPASSSASSSRSRPLGAARGKPGTAKPAVVRKLSSSGATSSSSSSSTMTTTKASGDAPAVQTPPATSSASPAATSEGDKPSSPKKRQDGNSDDEASTKETTTKKEMGQAAGVLVDTSDADTEKEPSTEEEQQQQRSKPAHELPSDAAADATAGADHVATDSSQPSAPAVEDEAKLRESEGSGDGDAKDVREATEATKSADDSVDEENGEKAQAEEEGDQREAHRGQDDEDAHRTSEGESEGDATSGNDEDAHHGVSTLEHNKGEENRSFDENAAKDEEGEEAEEEEAEEAEYDQGERENTRQLEEQVETLINEGTKLKMENKLMRSEVRALNDEVTSLTERITSEHEALERANDALHALQMEVLDKDRQLMRLRKQEDEFDAVLAKKDAQHAALQVKLEEANLHVAGLEQTTNALKQEIDRLHREKDETNDLHKQSIALINTKIAELENQLKEERESASSQRSLALERERNLESDISEYTKALGQAQRAIEDKNKQVEKHMASIKELEANVQGLKQELADYKLRAKKVLQQREATIQELTEKLTSPGSANAEEGELQEKWKELMIQKQEYESLKTEFDETKDELNKIKQNLAQTQEQAEHDALEFEEQVKALEDELEREREKVRKVQVELAQRIQELYTTKDQQNQATNGLKEQIKERDAQIAKLKRQITVKGIQSQSSSQAELESSLSAMTDRLIRLQALNETLTNEKAALQMRLNSEVQGRREREGIRRSGEVETKHSGDISSIIINTGAEPRQKSGPRLRSIASLFPESWSGDPDSKRHQVYTHTIRAVSALDSFTAKVGRILRRNPLARLLLILYMVFLHVWVLFLLSRPLEIHDMMDESLPPGAVPPTGLPDSLIHDSPAGAAAAGM